MSIEGMDTTSKLRTIWDTMDRQMAGGMDDSTGLVTVGPVSKTARFESMTDDDKRMQSEMRHQHAMRTAAELRLITSIDMERKSFSLAKPAVEKDLFSEKALTTAHFGGPRDYVSSSVNPTLLSHKIVKLATVPVLCTCFTIAWSSPNDNSSSSMSNVKGLHLKSISTILIAKTFASGGNWTTPFELTIYLWNWLPCR
eukprot:6447471-Pyramimonas_sp.AAC.1